MRAKRIFWGIAALALSLNVWTAMGQNLPSTAYTRGLLRSLDAASARTTLGLLSTNQSVVAATGIDGTLSINAGVLGLAAGGTMPAMNAAALTNLGPVAFPMNAIVVSPRGDDTKCKVGDAKLWAATLTNAIARLQAVCPTNGIIYLFPGETNIVDNGANVYFVSNRFTLYGQGGALRHVSNPALTATAILQAAPGSQLEIWDTYLIVSNSQPAALDWCPVYDYGANRISLYNSLFCGNLDSWQLKGNGSKTNCNFYARNCIFAGNDDTFKAGRVNDGTNSTLYFDNCQFIANTNLGPMNGFANGPTCGGGTYVFKNCDFNVGTEPASYALKVWTSAKATIIGGRLYSDLGTNLVVSGAGTTVDIYGFPTDPAGVTWDGLATINWHPTGGVATNTPTAGQILYSAGTAAYWGAPPAGGGGATNGVAILGGTGTNNSFYSATLYNPTLVTPATNNYMAAYDTLGNLIFQVDPTNKLTYTYKLTNYGQMAITGTKTYYFQASTGFQIRGDDGALAGEVQASGFNASSNLTIGGKITAGGSAGTAGQVLTSDGTAAWWSNAPAGGGSGAPLNGANVWTGPSNTFNNAVLVGAPGTLQGGASNLLNGGAVVVGPLTVTNGQFTGNGAGVTNLPNTALQIPDLTNNQSTAVSLAGPTFSLTNANASVQFVSQGSNYLLLCISTNTAGSIFTNRWVIGDKVTSTGPLLELDGTNTSPVLVIGQDGSMTLGAGKASFMRMLASNFNFYGQVSINPTNFGATVGSNAFSAFTLGGMQSFWVHTNGATYHGSNANNFVVFGDGRVQAGSNIVLTAGATISGNAIGVTNTPLLIGGLITGIQLTNVPTFVPLINGMSTNGTVGNVIGPILPQNRTLSNLTWVISATLPTTTNITVTVYTNTTATAFQSILTGNAAIKTGSNTTSAVVIPGNVIATLCITNTTTSVLPPMSIGWSAELR